MFSKISFFILAMALSSVSSATLWEGPLSRYLAETANKLRVPADAHPDSPKKMSHSQIQAHAIKFLKQFGFTEEDFAEATSRHWNGTKSTAMEKALKQGHFADVLKKMQAEGSTADRDSVMARTEKILRGEEVCADPLQTKGGGSESRSEKRSQRSPNVEFSGLTFSDLPSNHKLVKAVKSEKIQEIVDSIDVFNSNGFNLSAKKLEIKNMQSSLAQVLDAVSLNQIEDAHRGFVRDYIYDRFKVAVMAGTKGDEGAKKKAKREFKKRVHGLKFMGIGDDERAPKSIFNYEEHSVFMKAIIQAAEGEDRYSNLADEQKKEVRSIQRRLLKIAEGMGLDEDNTLVLKSTALDFRLSPDDDTQTISVISLIHKDTLETLQLYLKGK